MRHEYEGLETDERKRLQKWVAQLAELTPPDLTTAFVQTRVEFLIQKDGGQDGGADTVRVSTASLLRAMEAWEEGKEFTPKAMHDS